MNSAICRAPALLSVGTSSGEACRSGIAAGWVADTTMGVSRRMSPLTAQKNLWNRNGHVRLGSGTPRSASASKNFGSESLMLLGPSGSDGFGYQTAFGSMMKVPTGMCALIQSAL